MNGPGRWANQPRAAAGALAVLAAAGLGVWLAAGPAEAVLAPPTRSSAAKAPADAAPASADAPPEKTEAGLFDTSEAFRLPHGWRNDDGTFNQALLVAQQKKRLEVINKELKLHMKMTETAHFLIFSDSSDAVTQEFMQWSEALHANLCRQFSINPTERLWDGKCLLLLFATDAEFKEYAKAADGATAKDAPTLAAYFLWEKRVTLDGDAIGVPQLEHMCIPTEKAKPAELQQLFAHEATHAFFALYYKPVALPLWLNEGLAEYMTVFNDKDLRPGKLYMAKQYSTSGKSLKDLLANKMDLLEAGQYPVAYTMVECLLTQGGAKLKQLICNLKDGQTSDEALKAVYGFDTAGLEKVWREYLARQNAPARPVK
jgi:hypothetical protein